MENTVLLIVDMQEGLLKRHPYREEQLLSNITSLAGTARENGIEVIYFRHNGGKGSPLEKRNGGLGNMQIAVSPGKRRRF